MTGVEIVPVAKTAASVVKKAISDGDDKKELLRLAAESQAMQAAAEMYAQRVAVKQAVLLKVYKPLAKFLGISKAYFETDFHADMAEKVADIPEEHLITPSPSVAIPAMQGLAYSLDESDLKDMYLSLLATATDERVKEKAHPSFADIIKQLSPNEADLLLDVLRKKILPIVQLMIKAHEGPGETAGPNHIVHLVSESTGEESYNRSFPVWMDNWIRLGLVEVDYSRHLIAEEQYGWVEGRPEFERLASGDPRGKEAIRVQRGILHPTAFGSRFLSAVSFDGVPIEDRGDARK